MLDPLREWYGKPIPVTSGYRCPELNKAVGGVANSYHLKGMAADIDTGSKEENAKLLAHIRDHLPFTELGWEGGGHGCTSPTTPRTWIKRCSAHEKVSCCCFSWLGLPCPWLLAGAGQANYAYGSEVRKGRDVCRALRCAGPAASFEELPAKAEVPPVPLVVWTEGRPDTVWKNPDTAAMVQDYKLLRHYSRQLFNNENGVLRVKAGTQYNRLSYLDYEFTPVLKTTTSVVEKAWQPFASIGYSTNGSLSVGGGCITSMWAWNMGITCP